MGLRREAMGRSWIWLLALLVVGCSGAPALVPAQPMEAYEFRQTQGGIRVAVDPFFTTERARSAFRGGEDFAENGLLPVQVIIENGSAEDIQVSPRDFRLIRAGGQPEAPLPAHDAFQLVKLPWGWWAFLPVIGTGPSAYRNEVRLKDIESRELGETTIPAGQSVTGFVYFVIPENELDLAGCRIVFAVKGPGGRELIYDVAIAGRRGIPARPKSADSVGPAPLQPAPPDQSPPAPTRTEGAGRQGVIIRSPSQ